MNNLFFDLDGTLIESRPRLYQLFQDMVPASKLTFDDYWAFKRNKISHFEILREVFSYTSYETNQFEKDWLRKIELPERLLLDKPFDGVTDYLKKVSETHILYIVTARQSENRALDQIDSYGWLGIVDEVLVTGQTQEKYDLIKKKVTSRSNDWLVGDTGKDIQTGKKLGIKTAGVLTGFLNKEKLTEYKPDKIVNKVTELNFFVNNT